MTAPPLVVAALLVVFLLTAVISVVTGGTSLITVPVMMQAGLEPHKAVATNMLALAFLSLGETLPFLKGGGGHWSRLLLGDRATMMRRAS